MTTIKVWPTKASAVDLKHPHGPKLALTGATWPDDSFTGRRLVDKSATADEAEAYTAPKDAAAPVAASSTSA